MSVFIMLKLQCVVIIFSVKWFSSNGDPQTTNTFKQPLYHALENLLRESTMVWTEFVETKIEATRSPPLSLDLKVLNNFSQCSQRLVANLTAKLAPVDKGFCDWALRADGGGVKVGESYGKLTPEQLKRYEFLNCNLIGKGLNPTCDSEWGDGFVTSWKKKAITGLCDDPAATSKIKCFDSNQASRFCIFENAMLNFKKMRRRPRPDGTSTRQWERGFLAADCGYHGKDNIGYLQIYKPDIDGSSDALCDFVHNETVIAYSHDNIKSFGHTMSDYLNVWLMMWLTGISAQSQDVTFLNIDGIRSGHCFDDKTNMYFRHYDVNFRRVIKAVDYGKDATVCFKRLVMQPRPLIPFVKDGWTQDTRCSFVGPSSLFQRWNLQLRQSYGLLHPDAMPTNSRWKILLIMRKEKGHADAGASSRVFANQDELVSGLKRFAAAHGGTVDLEARDIAKLPFEDQVRLAASASIIVAMHGNALVHAMHMAVGTKYCCGVVEIFPEGEFRPIRGYGNMARRMGHHYERLDLAGNLTSLGGSHVPVPTLSALVSRVVASIAKASSCFLPSVLRNPYL